VSARNSRSGSLVCSMSLSAIIAAAGATKLLLLVAL
jgi:hypothetical protein